MRLNKEYISNPFLPLLWHCKVLLSVTTTNYGIEEQSKQNVGPLREILLHGATSCQKLPRIPLSENTGTYFVHIVL